MRLVLCAAAAALLSGCAYKAQAPVRPALDVYNNYADKIPGKYALFVDGSTLNRTARIRGFQCSAHNFPVEAAESFELSALRTLEQLVDGIERVDTPLDSPSMVARGLTGQIIIKAIDPIITVEFVPGFWVATPEGEAEISANVEAYGHKGRVFGSSVTATGVSSVSSGGISCSGGCGGGERGDWRRHPQTYAPDWRAPQQCATTQRRRVRGSVPASGPCLNQRRRAPVRTPSDARRRG